MAADDWYRNKTWDNNVAIEFEAKLKRSRGAFNKAQYLRIQASYLLENSDIKTQLIGVKLMERLICDFPDEDLSTIFGNEQLGDYYFNKNDFEKAEHYFQIVTYYYKRKKSRRGTSAIADLKLAETYFTANKKEKFDEAYKICKKFPLSQLTFNSEKFYFKELFAHICDKLNKQDEAKEYAKEAIEIAKITEPQFYRHKTIGLVNASDLQLNTLEQIAN